MRSTPRIVFALAALAAALLAAGCSDDDTDLDPGASTFTGNVFSVATGDGDPSLAGITVEVRGDGFASSVTDAAGGFLVAGAPTGEVQLVLRRGACQAVFPIDSVSSRSILDVVDVEFACSTLAFAGILESFNAILREDPFSRNEPLIGCVRVGKTNRTREIEASSATVIDEDGDIGSFFDLATGDRVQVDGDRDFSGRAATFLGSQVRVEEEGATDPCD